MNNLFFLKRDLLLKNSFGSLSTDFDESKLPPLVLKTSLKRGLINKESLLPAAFYLEMLTGQKVIGCRAKKSNAVFKIRQGDIIGWQVTLRNKKLKDFLAKWVNYILPVEGNLHRISNLSSFLELNEQILPEKLFMHVSFEMEPNHILSKDDNKSYSDLLLSGSNFPISWLKLFNQ